MSLLRPRRQKPYETKSYASLFIYLCLYVCLHVHIFALMRPRGVNKIRTDSQRSCAGPFNATRAQSKTISLLKNGFASAHPALEDAERNHEECVRILLTPRVLDLRNILS